MKSLFDHPCHLTELVRNCGEMPNVFLKIDLFVSADSVGLDKHPRHRAK